MIRRTEIAVEHPPRPSPTLKGAFARAAGIIAKLADTVLARRDSQELLEAAEGELARLPLAADEYVLALCRLKNARRYVLHGEWGAASYELRLMARCLHP